MTRTTPPAKLGLTQLEAREVPAAVYLLNGVLNVIGNDSDETITVRQTVLAVTVDGSGSSFSPLSIAEIRINANGGNDHVALNKVGAVVTAKTVVFGGSGNDTVVGGNGDDFIDGESGADYLYGSGGNDKLAGDIGNDFLFGQNGNDSVAGGAGNDSLDGGAGNDKMGGGAGADLYYTGAGDRVYDDTTSGVLIGGVAIGSGHAVFNGPSDLGWYDEHLGDAPIRRHARAAERDGLVSRVEMIEVLETAKDGGVVDGTEWADLKKVTAADAVGMSSAVRWLSNKVVGTSGENSWHTGGAGTRQVVSPFLPGITAARLQQLVDKWFRGADLPAAKSHDKTDTFSYQTAAGKLFVGGPAAADINQGGLGDCYYLAALGSVAHRNPQRIEDMFTDNGDGTWTVRFFRDGEVRFVTVNQMLPVNANGRLVFAGDGSPAGSATNELWVALAEKAYAQLNESGWIGQDGTNSYNGVGGVAGSDGINSGSGGDAMEHITGLDADGQDRKSVV